MSALLLICGTISGAALPWVLAQEVLRSKSDPARRRLAVSFCLFATVLQGAAAGLATCLIVSHYAGGWVVMAAFCSVFLIFLAATACGFFQGLQRFRLIAMLKMAEVMVKLGAGVALIALGAGASGAVAAFALGSGVVAGVGLAYMARDITWSWSALAGRHLWAPTQGLMAIQAGVAVLASMDVVIGSLVLGTQPALATYQAANIFGRVPVFIGAALSIVVFPRMIAAVTADRRPSSERALRLYVAICVPLAVVTATLPAPLVGALFPARYGDVAAILPWSAAAGLVMGVVNLTTTYFQASGIFRRTTSILAFGVALCAALDVFGLKLHGIIGLAAAVTIGGGVVAVALLADVARTWPGALRGLWRPCLGVLVGCLPLVPLRQPPRGLVPVDGRMRRCASVSAACCGCPPPPRTRPDRPNPAGPAPRVRGSQAAGSRRRVGAHPRDQPEAGRSVRHHGGVLPVSGSQPAGGGRHPLCAHRDGRG